MLTLILAAVQLLAWVILGLEAGWRLHEWQERREYRRRLLAVRLDRWADRCRTAPHITTGDRP